MEQEFDRVSGIKMKKSIIFKSAVGSARNKFYFDFVVAGIF